MVGPSKQRIELRVEIVNELGNDGNDEIMSRRNCHGRVTDEPS